MRKRNDHYTTPPCPICGKFMKKKKYDTMKIWICRYPQCADGKHNITYQKSRSLFTVLRKFYWGKGA